MALLRRCLAEMRSKHGEADDEIEWLGHEEVFLSRAVNLLRRDQSDGVLIPEQRRSTVTTVAGSSRAISRWPKVLHNGRWSLHEEDPVRGITTVIHIEADHANALLMRCLLASRINYVLHHAIDGNGGLELCKRVSPDLVITEIFA